MLRVVVGVIKGDEKNSTAIHYFMKPLQTDALSTQQGHTPGHQWSEPVYRIVKQDQENQHSLDPVADNKSQCTSVSVSKLVLHQQVLCTAV